MQKARNRRISLILVIVMLFGMFSPGLQLVSNAAESIKVIIDFEGYNLGQGFYIEPTVLEIPAGSNVAYAADMLLTQTSHAYTGGSISSGFYLDRVQGFDTGTVVLPSYLEEPIEDMWGGLDPGSGNGSLGAFDYCDMSGWMFSVNHYLSDVGASDYILNEGDVIRWQFTLWGIGTDLGLTSWSGPPLYTHEDKTDLFRTLMSDSANAAAKQNALDVIINPSALSQEIADAITALNSTSGVTTDAPSLLTLTVNTAAVAAFDPTVTNYDINVKGNASSLLIATFDSSKYTLSCNSSDYTSGQSISVSTPANSGVTAINLILTDKSDSSNQTIYTLKLVNPRAITITSTFKPAPASSMSMVNLLINGRVEGTMFQANAEGVATTTVTYSPTVNNYRTIFLTETDAIDVMLGTLSTAGYIRVLADSTEIVAPTAAATSMILKDLPITSGVTKITLDLCTKDTYAANANSFVSENSYNLFVDNLTLPADELAKAKIATLTLSAGDFASPFMPDSYVDMIWVKAAVGTNVTFSLTTLDSGTAVYKSLTSSTAGNTLSPTDGIYTVSSTSSTPFVPQLLTGQVPFATERVINGYTIRVQYKIVYETDNLGSGGSSSAFSIIGYLVPGSQYTNKPTYGLNGHLLENGSLRSLGNFGGYITAYFEDGIKNDPKNAYGVDLYISGNSVDGSAGFSEPGNVWVSEDNIRWYLLAGSDYFDDLTLRDYEVTYIRGFNGSSSYTDNYGSKFPINPALTASSSMYNYPVKSNYPLHNWKDGEEQRMTIKGPLLLSADSDPYNSDFAGFPFWGYVDVASSASSPYVSRGHGFDLDWAIDESTGKSVKLNEIHYVKVATASHIYAGAIGEKSTEVAGFSIATPTGSAVGKTAAPSAIKINNIPISLTTDVYNYTASFGTASLTIEVEGTGSSSVFINNASGASRTYTAAPISNTVRVVVQSDSQEPIIYYITDYTSVDKTALDSNITTAEALISTDYTASSWNNMQSVLIASKAIFTADDSTQTQVDNAASSLSIAITALVLRANTAALESKISEAAALTATDYTATSWSNLQTELTAAQAVAANSDATQTQVDNALTALNTAINVLETAVSIPFAPVPYKPQMDAALAYILSTVSSPGLGTSNGEWSILALARANFTVPDGYYEGYLAKVIAELQDAESGGLTSGQLDSRKSTENERLILALASLGITPTDVGGYNLLEPLANFDWTVWQGLNSTTFALLAFNANNFSIPDVTGLTRPVTANTSAQTTRQGLIDKLLDLEIKKGQANAGGWAQSSTTTADADGTSQAIQALAPYYNKTGYEDVTAAVDRALVLLSDIQSSNGGFTSWGTVNAESCAQVIVALTALGIDPQSDPRFIKATGNPVSALLSFYIDGSGFKHIATSGVNGIATDQSTYALVAYDRLKNNQTPLYDMSDMFTVPVEPGESISIVLSYQEDSSGFKIMRKTISIAPDLSEQYGYNDIFNGQKVSALDAVVAAHIEIFGADKTLINSKMALSNSTYGDFVSNFMGDGMGNMLYYVDGASAMVGAPEFELSDGSLIELFMVRDAIMWTDIYGWFKNGNVKTETASVYVGAPLTLNLQGNTYMGDAPVNGAQIVIVNASSGAFSTVLGTTDANGNVTIKFPSAGIYILGAVESAVAGATPLMSPWMTVTVTADPKAALSALIAQAGLLNANNYTSLSWNNLQLALTSANNIIAKQNATTVEISNAELVLNSAISNLQFSDSGGTTTNIYVTFRLIGAGKSTADINLSNGNYYGSNYVTWIPTSVYAMNTGDSVYDLFVKALNAAGLSSVGASQNYVKSITAPASLGGYVLGEFTNGVYSGWMYTINGNHPGYGLKDQALQNGDVVIWHYVNDYRYEVSDWFNEATHPSLGDGTFHNKWLTASDAPLSGSSSGNSSTTNNIITPLAYVQNGTASASVTDLEVSAALVNNTSSVIIRPIVTDSGSDSSARSINIYVPKKSLEDIAQRGVPLIVETYIGNLTFDINAQISIIGAVSGSIITIIIDDVDCNTLTPNQQEIIGAHPVINVTVLSNGNPISDLGVGTIKIAVPYNLKSNETASSLKVWHILNDSMTEVSSAYNSATKHVEFVTSHLSIFAVSNDVSVISQPPAPSWLNPFIDIKSSDWFYSSVEYVFVNGIMQGTSATTFSPNENVTRAMLVTMLYRIENEPIATGTNPFSDVGANEWYTNSVIWAASNGIVEGYPNGVFAPNASLTREQIATILYRYAVKKGLDASNRADLFAYTDRNKISDWAVDAMQWANAAEIINGRTATTLAPNGTATRAEVAAMIMRYIEDFAK